MYKMTAKNVYMETKPGKVTTSAVSDSKVDIITFLLPGCFTFHNKNIFFIIHQNSNIIFAVYSFGCCITLITMFNDKYWKTMQKFWDYRIIIFTISTYLIISYCVLLDFFSKKFKNNYLKDWTQWLVDMRL